MRKILCKKKGVVKRNEKDFSYWFVNRWKKEVWNCLMSRNYLSTDVYPRQALLYGSPHCGGSCGGIPPCSDFISFTCVVVDLHFWYDGGREMRKSRVVRVMGEIFLRFLISGKNGRRGLRVRRDDADGFGVCDGDYDVGFCACQLCYFSLSGKLFFIFLFFYFYFIIFCHFSLGYSVLQPSLFAFNHLCIFQPIHLSQYREFTKYHTLNLPHRHFTTHLHSPLCPPKYGPVVKLILAFQRKLYISKKINMCTHIHFIYIYIYIYIYI